MMKPSATASLLSLGLLAAVAGCAEAPPRPVEKPVAVAKKAAPPPVDRGSEARKAAEALAGKHGLGADEVRWDAGRKRFALVVRPKPPEGQEKDEKQAAPPARLLVYLGPREVVEHEVVGAQPPLELQFVGEDRLSYFVTPPPAPPPPAARATKGKKAGARGAKKGAAPPAPPRPFYVIQPIAAGSAPLRCEGDRFVWTEERDHLAWVGGEAGREFVGADGVQVYPRSGRTTIQGRPAWSTDGRSLALIEITSAEPRLVVLVETDNPNGDNTWALPPTARRPDYRVFWAGPGQLVVGESLTNPAFATSFVREEPQTPSARP